MNNVTRPFDTQVAMCRATHGKIEGNISLGCGLWEVKTVVIIIHMQQKSISQTFIKRSKISKWMIILAENDFEIITIITV